MSPSVVFLADPLVVRTATRHPASSRRALDNSARTWRDLSGCQRHALVAVMLMPFQSLPAAILSMRFRGNVPFAVAATWFSNPFTTPAILFGQFRLGQWMRDSLAMPMPDFLTTVQFNAPGVGVLNAAGFILGMITSGVLLALCAYPIVYLFSALLPHHLPVRSRSVRAAKHASRRATPSVQPNAG